MARVVQDAAGKVGPLTVIEIARAMGYGSARIKQARLDGQPLKEKDEWLAIGNSIHASVLCHEIVSLLVAKGYITRDDPRLKGQIWTVNQDGPCGWRKLQQLVDSIKENKGGAS